MSPSSAEAIDWLTPCLWKIAPAGTSFARSVEGGDTQDWPHSPPLQQLDACPQRGQRQGLVGLGAAGTSHWSLAVESDVSGCLSFDVACRVRTPPIFLGSTYELVLPTGQHTHVVEGISFDGPEGWRWSLQGGDRDGPVRCQLEAQRLVIRPANCPDTWPATIRWKYRLQGTIDDGRVD